MTIHTLFITVGTSLLSALRADDCPDGLRGALSEGLDEAARIAGVRAIGSALASGRWEDKWVGAEISSIRAMERAGHLPEQLHEVCLAVSETEDGRLVGALLAAWAEARGWRARVAVIPGLTPNDPATFASVGLRNLVRAVGETVRRAGGTGFVAIVATGGFKAQVATVAVAAQALGATVFNLHERFAHVIALPPLAVSFDFAPLLSHLDLVVGLEEEGVLSLADGTVPPALEPFLTHVPGDEAGQGLWELAPVGQIYLEAFRQRFPPSRALPPEAEARKPPTFRDDHFPKGFREYVQRVWDRTPQLITGHTVPFDRQQAIRARGFYWRDAFLIAEYRDHSGFGARLAFSTTAVHEGQRLALLADVMARFAEAEP